MKRSFGVTLVGVLLLVQGLYLAALTSAAIFLNVTVGGGWLRSLLAVDFAPTSTSDWLSAVLVGALGIFIVLSGIGFLRLLPWAWLAAMALQGWTLALFLLGYFTHGQNIDSTYPSVLLSVVIVFYLNSRTVRHTFDLVRRREAAAAAVPPAITHAGMATEAEVTSRSTRAQ